MKIISKMKTLSIREFDMILVLLWLMKDMSWMMGWKYIGAFLAIPTILLSIWITYKCKQNTSDFWYNLATVFWITANSIWMIGEFYLHVNSSSIALIFFTCGFLSIFYFCFRNKGLFGSY